MRRELDTIIELIVLQELRLRVLAQLGSEIERARVGEGRAFRGRGNGSEDVFAFVQRNPVVLSGGVAARDLVAVQHALQLDILHNARQPIRRALRVILKRNIRLRLDGHGNGQLVDLARNAGVAFDAVILEESLRGLYDDGIAGVLVGVFGFRAGFGKVHRVISRRDHAAHKLRGQGIGVVLHRHPHLIGIQEGCGIRRGQRALGKRKVGLGLVGHGPGADLGGDIPLQLHGIDGVLQDQGIVGERAHLGGLRSRRQGNGIIPGIEDIGAILGNHGSFGVLDDDRAVIVIALDITRRYDLAAAILAVEGDLVDRIIDRRARHLAIGVLAQLGVLVLERVREIDLNVGRDRH